MSLGEKKDEKINVLKKLILRVLKLFDGSRLNIILPNSGY